MVKRGLCKDLWNSVAGNLKFALPQKTEILINAHDYCKNKFIKKTAGWF